MRDRIAAISECPSGRQPTDIEDIVLTGFGAHGMRTSGTVADSPPPWSMAALLRSYLLSAADRQ